MTNSMENTTDVYGVFTMGTDYYDTDWLLHTLYANAADADRVAAELRTMKDEFDENEPFYEAVEVQVLTVR